MKKLLITMTVLTGMVAGAMVFSSFATPKQDKNTESNMTIPIDGPGTCVQVGNCSVEISRWPDQQGYKVTATNFNSYRVSVDWGAYCYINGEKTRVGGGTLTVGGKNGNSTYSNSANVYSTYDNVYLDDVHVYKCD